MLKKIKMYPSKIRNLSKEDFISSFKEIKVIIISKLLIFFGLFLVFIALYHLIALPDFMDNFISGFIVLSFLAFMPSIYKWIVHDEEYRRRTKDIPLAFEEDEKAYEKIQNRTKVIGISLVLAVVVMMIVDVFFYELESSSYLVASGLLIISFLLMHIYDLRKHIRKNFIRNHHDKEKQE